LMLGMRLLVAMTKPVMFPRWEVQELAMKL
jgi:hypothetical protein